jgi:hypothetical protein
MLNEFKLIFMFSRESATHFRLFSSIFSLSIGELENLFIILTLVRADTVQINKRLQHPVKTPIDR